jgi:hypothetical protein
MTHVTTTPYQMQIKLHSRGHTAQKSNTAVLTHYIAGVTATHAHAQAHGSVTKFSALHNHFEVSRTEFMLYYKYSNASYV